MFKSIALGCVEEAQVAWAIFSADEGHSIQLGRLCYSGAFPRRFSTFEKIAFRRSTGPYCEGAQMSSHLVVEVLGAFFALRRILRSQTPKTYLWEQPSSLLKMPEEVIALSQLGEPGS